MTAPTRDPIRELAEEIARNVAGASSGELSEDDPVYKGALEYWESHLRSSLPALSSLLAELAVAREALQGELVTEDFAGDDTTRLRCSRCGSETAGEWEELEHSGDCPLSSAAGRLAREVLRAAVAAHESGFTEEPEVFERFTEAVVALLAALPSLREEVGG